MEHGGTMRMGDGKPWRCKGGHALGQVMRNGSGVRRLFLFREAQAEPGEGNTEVMAVVEGFVADVRCSVCGEIRTWFPGEEALKELLKRVKGNSNA